MIAAGILSSWTHSIPTSLLQLTASAWGWGWSIVTLSFVFPRIKPFPAEIVDDMEFYVQSVAPEASFIDPKDQSKTGALTSVDNKVGGVIASHFMNTRAEPLIPISTLGPEQGRSQLKLGALYARD
ncbi:hypothetical protein BX600DRAFT_439424 [Xylariales sp. PMI_506]|nr:hypothetical protein BX600DRAFT_439424 [Xylariales sp. PMI_506]